MIWAAGMLGGIAGLGALSVCSWRKCILTGFYNGRLTPSRRDAEWLEDLRREATS